MGRVFISTPDLADEDLRTRFHYAAGCFGLGREQLLLSPPSGIPLVAVQTQHGRRYQGETPLEDFVHPEECCYVFGPCHGIMEPPSYELAGSVYIPSSPACEFIPSQACAIVFYDRRMKGGDFG